MGLVFPCVVDTFEDVNFTQHDTGPFSTYIGIAIRSNTVAYLKNPPLNYFTDAVPVSNQAQLGFPYLIAPIGGNAPNYWFPLSKGFNAADTSYPQYTFRNGYKLQQLNRFNENRNVTRMQLIDPQGNIVSTALFNESLTSHNFNFLYSGGAITCTAIENNTLVDPKYFVISPVYDAGWGQAGFTEDLDVSAINMLNYMLGHVPYVVNPADDDPYSQGGISSSGGGDGSFDFESTDVGIPGLPSIGIVNSGLVSVYLPTSSQLQSLGSYLWSGLFDLDTFKKLLADPMEGLIGLKIIPTISGHPTYTNAEIVMGNAQTGVQSYKATEQYYELDCGTVNVPPKWGAYLDFSPYAKLSLYLPYIGMVSINPDDCVGGSIHVVYHIDILSGTCIAFVYCVSNGINGHVLYTFTGSCACECPLTASQYGNVVSGLVGVAAGVATVASGGGATAVMAGIGQASNSVVNAIKPDVSRSGGFGGSGGLMGIQYPYLILTIPKLCTPENLNSFVGYPAYITVDLSEVSGYTEIHSIHPEGFTCTDSELEELNSILEGGVLF
jgi:hypothetical protein